MRPLVAGNWKMNGLTASLGEIEAVVAAAGKYAEGCDIMICPPAGLIMAAVARASSSPLAIGAQDCHTQVSGAHTGDLSAVMFADLGAEAVIVGHSERRADHGESDQLVRKKATATHEAGLTAIICVGETESERRAGSTISRVLSQLEGSVPDSASAFEHCVIAYEPVWAIGSGLTPTVDDVAEVHLAIREWLVKRFGHPGNEVRILYGGSVKPSNAAELMAVANVDGALVGGASLKAEDFLAIASVYAPKAA